MKKYNSIYFHLILRLVVSVIYFVNYIFLNNFIFNIGKIEDIGLKNAMVIGISITILMFMLMCATESLYRFIDPVNAINVIKYRIIFLIQVMGMIINSYILMNHDIDSKMRLNTNSIIILIALIVLYIHSSIIKQYQAYEKEEIRDLILKYQLPMDEQLLSKLSVIKVKMLYFVGYLILVGLFMKYALINLLTSGVFICLNVWVIHRLFSGVLEELYKYYGDIKKSKIVLIKGYIISSISYIAIYIMFHDGIDISIFDGRTPDEFAMVWYLSFIPFVSHLINFYLVELRMTRKWISEDKDG